MKKYSVSVHATFVFDTEVEADSREEAERKAFQKACESETREWEFADYQDRGEVYDEEDIPEEES